MCTCTNNNIQTYIAVCFRFMLAGVRVSTRKEAAAAFHGSSQISFCLQLLAVSAYLLAITLGVVCALQMPWLLNCYAWFFSRAGRVHGIGSTEDSWPRCFVTICKRLDRLETHYRIFGQPVLRSWARVRTCDA